jgi:CBS domain containing-hemolysin-like protein
VVRQHDGSFLADARAPLEDVVAVVGPEFEVSEVTSEVDTLAGYIMTRVGRLPARGEVVPGPGEFEIEVLDADPRRMKRLRITKGRPARRGTNRQAVPPTAPAAASEQPAKGSS